MQHKKTTLQSFNINLFIIILFGLVILSSATAVVGYTHFGDNYYYLKHQLLYGLLPGLFLFFLFSKISYRVFQKHAGLIFLISIIFLFLVFIPGVGKIYNQARSWIDIGGLSLQPSELAKLGLIIYLSAWFAKSREHVKSFSHGLLPFLILIGLVAGLIALQPDIGTMIIACLIGFGIYFSAGGRWKHILGLFVLGGVALTSLILTAPYRLNRLLAFINPEADLQGAGYHINQALIAIGSGGIFGLGLGHSRQKFEYLPEVAGDSIFAIMAEEGGLFIGLIFLILLVIFVNKIFKLSKNSSDTFVKFFALGMAIWIGGQAVINIGAMVGILPLTGVPLPFVSYGGTALMSLLAGCGILVNALKHS
ncbi:putative lipid II flippase FtsW [Patescibacteria group bacterium]